MSRSCFFWDKVGHEKSVGLRSESDEVRAEYTPGYLEITSSSLIYYFIHSWKKELSFWLAQGLNRLTHDPSLSDETLN